MVSADSLDQPVLRQPWIMDDGEPAGLTGNNSLPRGPTPFTGHNTTSQERVGAGERVEGHILGTHILVTRLFILFFPYLLQETGFSLAAQLPRVTSHYQNEIWRCHRSVPLSGAGPNKVPYVVDEELRLTVAS